jgi:hypothetical protein
MDSGRKPAAVNVVLEGGPPDLPMEDWTRWMGDEVKIKIPHCGGYEHFERVDATSRDDQRIFRWIMRTEVAE